MSAAIDSRYQLNLKKAFLFQAQFINHDLYIYIISQRLIQLFTYTMLMPVLITVTVVCHV